jgi:hypothetical protein
VLTGNSAGAFIFGVGDNVTFDPSNTNSSLTMTGDTTLAPVSDGGQTLLQQWLAANPGFSLPGSPTSNPPPAPAPPPAPVNLSLDATTDSGIAGDGVTNLSQVRIDGSASAGSKVLLYDGAALIGQGVADATGAFNILVGGGLTTGSHSITATASTSAGTSSASSAVTVLVDPLAPTALIVGASQAASGNSEIVQLSGSSHASVSGVGYAIDILQDNTVIGTVKPGADGGWAFGKQVVNAAHTYTLKIVDNAGNVGAGNSLTLASAVTTNNGHGHGGGRGNANTAVSGASPSISADGGTHTVGATVHGPILTTIGFVHGFHDDFAA